MWNVTYQSITLHPIKPWQTMKCQCQMLLTKPWNVNVKCYLPKYHLGPHQTLANHEMSMSNVTYQSITLDPIKPWQTMKCQCQMLLTKPWNVNVKCYLPKYHLAPHQTLANHEMSMSNVTYQSITLDPIKPWQTMKCQCRMLLTKVSPWTPSNPGKPWNVNVKCYLPKYQLGPHQSLPNHEMSMSMLLTKVSPWTPSNPGKPWNVNVECYLPEYHLGPHQTLANHEMSMSNVTYQSITLDPIKPWQTMKCQCQCYLPKYHLGPHQTLANHEMSMSNVTYQSITLDPIKPWQTMKCQCRMLLTRVSPWTPSNPGKPWNVNVKCYLPKYHLGPHQILPPQRPDLDQTVEQLKSNMI